MPVIESGRAARPRREHTMSKLIIPEGYQPKLNLYDTQKAIGTIKRLFADTL